MGKATAGLASWPGRPRLKIFQPASCDLTVSSWLAGRDFEISGLFLSGWERSPANTFFLYKKGESRVGTQNMRSEDFWSRPGPPVGAGCNGSARATNANNVCVLCLPTVFPRPLLSSTPCYMTDWPILDIYLTFLFHLEFSSAVSHSGWLALAQIVVVPEKRHGERRERIHTMLNNHGA